MLLFEIDLLFLYFLFNRIVDKKKPANDLSDPCNIDRVSETEIVDAVEHINYTIDSMICNLLYAVKDSKLHICSDTPLEINTSLPTEPQSSIIPHAFWSLLKMFGNLIICAF